MNPAVPASPGAVATDGVVDESAADGRSGLAAVRSVAALEARRNLRDVGLWAGLLGGVLLARTTANDWQGAVYGTFPMLFVPLMIAIFVAGVRSGGRDRHPSLPPLAEEAPLGPAPRAAGRLLGLLPLVAIGAGAVVLVAIGIRLEGGHWVGDAPGRTDEAVHTLPEVIQPMVLMAVAAAVGVAVGRTVRRTGPAMTLGVVLWFLMGVGTWAWQWVPARYVTLVQTQPIEQRVGPADADPHLFPDEWLLSAPDQYDQDWDRILVHQAMAAWHDVYLVGIAAAAAGIAVRGRNGRRLVAAGAVIAVLGVTAQAVVAPPGEAVPEVTTRSLP